MKKTKLSEILGMFLAIGFILVIALTVYTKYSDSCGILGPTVEAYIAPVLCQKPEDKSQIDAESGTGQENQPSLDISSDDSSKTIEQLLADNTKQQTSQLDAKIDTVQADNAAQGISSELASGVEALDSEDSKLVYTSTNTASTNGSINNAAVQQDALSRSVPSSSAYETPALLVAENKLKITSLLPAKVKSIGFRDGQEFKKDDILIIFDCRGRELELAIEQEVLKDRQAALENYTKLKELKSTSEYSIVKAESEVAQTKKAIEKLEFQLSRCVIKADYSGKVIINNITETEFLQAGQEIMTVNNNDDLLVKAYIPVVWLDWLNIGTTFNLCMSKNKCYKGVVNRVGAEVDAISQTLDVFGKLTEKDDNLLAGLSGQVTFEK